MALAVPEITATSTSDRGVEHGVVDIPQGGVLGPARVVVPPAGTAADCSCLPSAKVQHDPVVSAEWTTGTYLSALTTAHTESPCARTN